MSASKGNCYICGAELGKTAMKNHILKEHNGPEDGQECVLLKIEGAYERLSGGGQGHEAWRA